MEIERKTFILQKASIDDGEGVLTGYANNTGNIDRADEIVLPGAYANIDSFVRDGFSSVGHDWIGLPIGTIDDAKEDENGLWVKMRFHSTDEAQKARTVCRERLERGKSVGLSIGYEVLDSESGIDETTGKRVRYLKSINLYEFSIVTVPANPRSVAQSVKGAGLPLDDQVDAVLDAAERLAERIAGLKAIRESEGRNVSKSRVEPLRKLARTFANMATDIAAKGAGASAYRELAFRTLDKITQGDTR